MAAAQRWSGKRGWAAAFQRRRGGGPALRGQQGRSGNRWAVQISSSVPPEFESMLEESAVLAPGGVEQPLQHLRSRILTRHTRAMLKRGVTLVGMRASGLNLWLLEVLAACILCFDGPWIATGGLELGAARLVPGRLARHGQRQGFCLCGSNVCRRSRRGSRHVVQQVEVMDNSPTTPHWPVRLTLKATSWGHRVLTRKRPKPFPRRCQWDRNARRSTSTGPGQQRNLPPTWNWRG